MTTESYIIILILTLLVAKYLISTNKKAQILALKKSLFTLPSIHQSSVFLFAVVSAMWIGEQVIGSALIIGFSWVLFKKLCKSLTYEWMLGWSFIIFLAFFLASYLGMKGVPNETIWFIMLFSWGLTLILILMIDVLKKLASWLVIPITLLYSWLILALPLNYLTYFLTFHTTLNVGQINAIFQTTFSESFEFLQEHGSFINTLIVLLFLGSVSILVVIQNKKQTQSISGNTFGTLAMVILFITSLNIIPKIPIIDLVLTSMDKYETEVKEFRRELEKRKAGDINFTATKKDGNELLIVIIGESLNKNNMGVYGYLRNTTPHLAKMEHDSLLIKYDQAFSNHVHTVPTLTFALTEANQINQMAYNTSLSILDIHEQAGYDTYWISNQVAIGGWDNPVSVLAERADFRFNLNNNIGLNTHTNVYDIQVANKLKAILEKPITKNTVIYVHLMGSHGLYKNRYPETYKVFREPFNTKDFGSKNYWYQHINEYDNSVLYNDFIVSEIVKTASSHNGNTACIYFSDHSEDILENNGHDEGNFTYPMAQIPMLAWFSDSYKNTYPDKISAINKHKNDLFSNGFIYDFLIGVSDIKTAHYNPAHDPSSDSYFLSPTDSYTLHGKKKMDANENYFYHEKLNLNTLKERGELSRVFPHRTNTTGALKTILYNGCNSFELDLVFKGMGDTSYFEVGHGENEMTGMKFEEMLRISKDYGIQKIWLDIKNINEQNLSSVLHRLLTLDKTYNLKPKLIVETSMTSEAFATIRASGFHTSYYLPTHYQELDDAGKAKVANEIAQQVRLQKVGAVSFDFALYPFVKKFIEPQLDSAIVYHTWNVTMGFEQPDLMQKLANSAYYQDPRVKTILIKYKNDFEL